MPTSLNNSCVAAFIGLSPKSMPPLGNCQLFIFFSYTIRAHHFHWRLLAQHLAYSLILSYYVFLFRSIFLFIRYTTTKLRAIKKRLGVEAIYHWPSLVTLYLLVERVSKPTGLGSKVAGGAFIAALHTIMMLTKIDVFLSCE